MANLAITSLSASGTVCVFTSARAHIVVDRAGTYGTGSRFSAIGPVRLFDTRDGFGAVAAGNLLILTPSPTLLPAGTNGVVVNVTATQEAGPGFITVYPCGTLPEASNLNFAANKDVAALASTPLAGNGSFCLYARTTTHMVVDLVGVWS